MNRDLEFIRKFSLAYAAACKPLCQELKLPQTAFDILMFLANNPAYQTAADIAEVRRIKPNLISVNVERLVREGYLRREGVAGDRRKTRLRCTAQAEPVAARGRAVQEAFFARLFSGVDEAARAAFFDTAARMNDNLDTFLKEEC